MCPPSSGRIGSRLKMPMNTLTSATSSSTREKPPCWNSVPLTSAIPTTPTGLSVERWVWSTVEENSFGIEAGIEPRPRKVSLTEEPNWVPEVLIAVIGFWCVVVTPRPMPMRLPRPVLPLDWTTASELTGLTVAVRLAPCGSV